MGETPLLQSTSNQPSLHSN